MPREVDGYLLKHRELIFVKYMAHEQVSWVYTAFAGAVDCWTVVLC